MKHPVLMHFFLAGYLSKDFGKNSKLVRAHQTLTIYEVTISPEKIILKKEKEYCALAYSFLHRPTLCGVYD